MVQTRGGNGVRMTRYEYIAKHGKQSMAKAIAFWIVRSVEIHQNIDLYCEVFKTYVDEYTDLMEEWLDEVVRE